MIAELFEPADIECLVKSAVELWEVEDASGLSGRQQEVLNRARNAVYADLSGEPLPYQAVTSLVPQTQQAEASAPAPQADSASRQLQDGRQTLSARLRDLAAAWMNAADGDSNDAEHDAAHDLVDAVTALTEGEGHFLFPRGWGRRANGPERGRAFVALGIALGGDEEPPSVFSDEVAESAESMLPEIIAALWTLADELDLDMGRLAFETVRLHEELS